jgi:hypothetical protein
MIDVEALKAYAYDTIGAIHEVHKELGPGLFKTSVGILVNFYPRFAEIERYFFDTESNEIYGSDGFPIRKHS